MEEVWKTCNDKDFKNYEVSTHGRIRNAETGRLMKTQVTEKGYESLTLAGMDGPQTRRVHRLVAKTFLEHADDQLDVSHRDGNRRNNRVDNLMYRTRSEVIRRSFAEGREQTHRMRPIRCVQTGEVYPSIIACAHATGLNRHIISKCVNGSTKKTKGGLSFEPLD